MSLLVDLGVHGLAVAAGAPIADVLDWDEFAALWNANDLVEAHNWLNLRWSRRVETRVAGAADPEARFLQGLAYATLALHFTQAGKQDSALLMLDDALIALGPYRPEFLGVRVDPVVGTLGELRPLIASLAPDADNPMFPFVYCKLEHRTS